VVCEEIVNSLNFTDTKITFDLSERSEMKENEICPFTNTFIEVCAGGGGLSAGLIKSGFTPILLNDNNSDCCKTLKHNHPTTNVVCNSMDKIDFSPYIGKVDLLTGGVPCFVAGTIILTDKGYRNIEFVSLEDKLMTHTGNFQEIVNIQRKMYNGCMYDLKFKYQPKTISCTEEHPFYVREKRRTWDTKTKQYKTIFEQPVWKKACELTKNDYFGMVINTKEIIPELAFKNTDTKLSEQLLDNLEYWFILGYLVGNGYILRNEGMSRNKVGVKTKLPLRSYENIMNEDKAHIISFAVDEKHEEYILKRMNAGFKGLKETNSNENEGFRRSEAEVKHPFKELSKENGKFQGVDGDGDNSLFPGVKQRKNKKYEINDINWYNILFAFGESSFNKRIPEWVQNAPIEFVQEFMNGYIKTTGVTIESNKPMCSSKYIKITVVYPSFAYGLQRLFLKLGHIFTIDKVVPKKISSLLIRNTRQRYIYIVKGSLIRTSVDIPNVPHSPSLHSREFSKIAFIEKDYVWFSSFQIMKKETMRSIPVYNFEVKNDNSYIAMNTITHNCQSFSQAGLRKGLDDPRGDLMMKFIDILNLVRPKTFMIENVKGLLTHDEGKTIQKIIEELNKNGLYNITYKCLDASKYDVPQKRERVFIVGVMKSIDRKFEFPIESPIKKVLKDVLYDVPFSNGTKYNEEKIKLFKMIPQGGCWVNLPENLQKEYLGNSYNSGGGKRGILYRLSMEKPSLTLLCTPSQKQTERCHPLEERPLTIREYARIQTFDDNYEFIGSMNSQYKQIGNAVPVELAKHMGDSLLKVLVLTECNEGECR
jgi:DNA (cytosine-5)-methyltransferase 1